MVTGGWKSTGSFQFRRLRSDHVTNVTADGDANHSPALGGCFTVLSASALSLALPVERAHSNLAVPPTAVAGTASVLGELLGPSGSVLTRRSLGRLAGIRESGFHDFPAGSSLGVADALAAPCPRSGR